MREKQVVLFDLDGTIVDSMAGITRSYQYALAHFGVEVENPDALARFVGPSLYRTFAEEYGFAGSGCRRPWQSTASILRKKACLSIRSTPACPV